MDNAVNINEDRKSESENNIKFKAIQYFSNPPMVILFSKLKTANVDDYRQLVLMRRIREAIGREGLIIDESIKEIQDRYLSELPEGKEPNSNEINTKINTFLVGIDVVIPLPKLKLSQIKGIESLADLDALEGIIEVDVE